MDAPKSQLLIVQPRQAGYSGQVPALTLLMVGSAVLSQFIPGSARWLIYDRAAILSGEIWRMFTGHWVHFSIQHFAYDVLALGLASWIIETRRLRYFGWLCFVAPWTISALLLVFEPQMQFCGGLSGLATSAIIFLAVSGLRDPAPWCWVCRGVLLGTVGKILIETQTGHMLFATTENIVTVSSVSSHIAGAILGLALAVATRQPRLHGDHE